MKLKLLLLCCLFWLAGTAQNLVTVSPFSMPSNVPANTADWGNLTTLMVVAIANGTPIPSALQDAQVAFTVKRGGSKVCGGTLQAAQFTARNKYYKGSDISGMLGGCVLQPGTYQLCVQFFANTNGSLVPVSAEKCSSNEFVIENAGGGNPTGSMKYAPPQNIDPADKKLLRNTEIKAPLTFRWTPCLPKPQDPVMYRLKVWQLMQGQNGNAAMKANTPIVEKEVKDITQATIINLNAEPCMLPRVCAFVWSVDAIDAQGKVLGSSEPTMFNIADENPTGSYKYAPPENIDPRDKKIMNKKEVQEPITFRWTPLVPRPRDPVLYRLRVWQLMQGQKAEEAMRTNNPVVTKDVNDKTQFVKPNLMGDIEMIGGTANLVWNVEAVGEQGNVLGSSQPTTFSVSSGGCITDYTPCKIDSIICKGNNQYKVCATFNVTKSGFGASSSSYTAYPTKIIQAQFFDQTLSPVGIAIPINVNKNEGQSYTICQTITLPATVTTLTIKFDAQVQTSNPAFDNCVGTAKADTLLPNCTCNPCKDKQTSFGKDSANFNNVGQVNSLNTVSHGPAKVIKVAAQIIDFERLGENGCMKCTKDSREFGNFIGGNLNGNGGIITKGNYGKQIQWQFSTPTTVSSFAYELNMMFPPLQEVSCCKDSIRVCTRWSFTDENCITCDTLICKVIVREYKKYTGPYYPGGATAIYAAQMAKMGEPYNSWYKQKSSELPANFNEQVNELYKKNNLEKEIEFLEYLERMKRTFTSIQNLTTTTADAVWNAISANALNTQCGNGDFETGLNTSEWSGAYLSNSSFLGSINDPILANPFTLGFNPISVGAYVATNNHSIVSYGPDPVATTIFTTPISTSLKSFRLGNAVNGDHGELISKKFLVSGDGVIKFQYALVLQNPISPSNIHPANNKPSFWVKVYDNTGTPILNKVYLEPSSGLPLDNVAADINPFFQNMTYLSENLSFRDWTCAKIDLSSYVGQTVSVALITTDCTQGGHFGYAYIDDWCGKCSGSSSGSVTVKPISDSCIKTGTQVCVDYTLPKGTTAGSGTLSLQFYQNGIAYSTPITSPTLTTDGTYCFGIATSKLPCNAGQQGYDFVVTGNFTIGTATVVVTAPDPVGTSGNVEGYKPGKNNDLVCCNTLAELCCTNFVKTVSATTTMIGSTAAGYNTIKFIPTFTAGPKLIKKVVISIVNFETNSSNKECLTCESNTNNYGSMYVPRSFSGAGTDPIEGMSVASTGLLYSCVGCPPTWNTATNTHEVIWGSNSGSGYNLMDGTGDQSTTFFVRMPKKSTIACCDDTVKICVKYSFTDVDCKTCDTIICYKIINRQTVTNLSASTNGGSSSMARGVQPDGSNDSVPRIPVKGSLRKTDPPVSAPTTSGGTIPRPK